MDVLNASILILGLFFSVYLDIKERRIPNILTIPMIILGILISLLNNGFSGLLFSITGLLLGFAIFFIPFMLGGMGAGDVKLMAAIGSLMGWPFALNTALWTAISGGMIVIIYTIHKGELGRVLGNIIGWGAKPILSSLYLRTGNKKILSIYEQITHKEAVSSKSYIPYGVAIAMGTMIVLIRNLQGITF